MYLPSWPKYQKMPNRKKYDLSVMHNLVEALKIDLSLLAPIIHIAGTNGKGSTQAMLKAVFEAAGYKVHSYTSPHLLEFNERILLQGQKISDEMINELAYYVKSISEKENITPSFFEATTLIAFLAFGKIPADIILLETGMGGRLDSTNFITKPLLSLITSISFDHMDYLGNTIEEITKEKAGIIKNESLCVISAQNDEKIYKILIEECKKKKTLAFCYEYDYKITPFQALEQKNKSIKNYQEIENFYYYSSLSEYSSIYSAPALLDGYHQLFNAASVISAVKLLVKKQKFNISDRQIKQGLEKAKWPARLQKIIHEKYHLLLPKEYQSKIEINPAIEIWLDGAHNEGGAKALADWIIKNNKQKNSIYLILGMLKSKDTEGFCRPLQNLITKGYTVKIDAEVDSLPPDELAAKAAKIMNADFSIANSLQNAFYQIISEINQKNEKNIIIVAGSLFLAADLLRIIENRANERANEK